jgi:hypothetical protein
VTPASAPIGRVLYEPATHSVGFTVVAANGVVVVLHGEVDPAILVRVWMQVADDRRTLERVVQSIPSVGPDAVSSFVVAALDGGPAHAPAVSIVARGASVVDVSADDDPSPRRFSSQGLQPWHLASFASVKALRFDVDAVDPQHAHLPLVTAATAVATGFELPMVFGVVQARAARWVLTEPSDEGASVTAALGAIGASSHVDSEITLERAARRPRGRHGGAPHQLDDTPPLLLPSHPPRQMSDAPPIVRPSRVRVGSGVPVELHVPVYIGRRPRSPGQLIDDQVILIEVPSPSREVSASHVRVARTGDEVVATDLNSTNGTTVTLPGAPRIKLGQGDSIVLPPYSRIDIGDGNVIEILPGAD